MLIIGSHMTIAKGFTHAANATLDMGGNTFQFFSRNPRGSSVKAFDGNDIKTFQKIRKDNKLGPIMSHAPYTLNLASDKKDIREFSTRIIHEDIARMDSIGIEFFNFHPGSHVDSGVDEGIKNIIAGLNKAITGDENIKILLETMSGKGSEIGFEFEQLKRIIDDIEHKEKLGVCMDVCHIFSAGYDIVNNLDAVLDEFNNVIGIDNLKAIHLNDSMMDFSSRKDRHMSIGEGKIGLDAILKFMEHKYIKKLPFYLETPLDDEGHKKEINMLRKSVRFI